MYSYLIILVLFLCISTLSVNAYGQTFNESNKIIASDGAPIDRFGRSVSLSSDGTVAIIGANLDDSPRVNAGSAYIFTKNDNNEWIEVKKLVPADSSSVDFFGESVSLSSDGTVALVGSPRDDINFDSDVGSAYIFTKNEGGEWIETAKLTASDAMSNDQFGTSVAISGDGTTALIGSQFGDSEIQNSGSAYIFKNVNGEWIETAKLTASDAAERDRFGQSVSVSGDGKTAVIGAFGDDVTVQINIGAGYIFTQNDNNEWIEVKKFIGSNTRNSDQFGISVSISEDGKTIAAGAKTEDTPVGSNNGSAYVFEKDDQGSWNETARLLPSDGSLTTIFFSNLLSISRDGTHIIVSSHEDDLEEINNAGSAYIFTKNEGGEWIETAKLTASDAMSNDQFGTSVAISGDGTTALIGSQFDDVNGLSDVGSAYAFNLSSGEFPKFIDLPEAIVINTVENQSILVTYEPPIAIDENNNSLPVICTPSSNTVFIVGITTITCTAMDINHNIITATFRVIINNTYDSEDARILKKGKIITDYDKIQYAMLTTKNNLPIRGEGDIAYGLMTTNPSIIIMAMTHVGFTDNVLSQNIFDSVWHIHYANLGKVDQCSSITEESTGIDIMSQESHGSIKVGGSIIKIKNVPLGDLTIGNLFGSTVNINTGKITGNVITFKTIPLYNSVQDLEVICIDDVQMFVPNTFIID